MGYGNSISNDLIINISNTTFKSFCAGEIFTIPDGCLDIDEIVDYSVSISIGSVHTTSTPIGTANSGQTLTGNKLVICGKACLDVSILPINDQPIRLSSYSIPICTFIVVPTSVTTINCTDISYTIEDVYLVKINSRQFMTCINILLEA